MNIYDCHPDDLARGYAYDPAAQSYACLFCGARYEKGVIYPAGEKLIDACRAMDEHITDAHGSAFEAVLSLGKKATRLTDVQAQLMRLFYAHTPDKEIAARTGVAASTVRAQRHALREKARQARLFLALWEGMEQSAPRNDKDALITIHPGARMVDDRYLMTEAEAEAILRKNFSSLDPLKLTSFPHKQKKKVAILRAIADQFEHGVRYPGRQVDETLAAIFDDYVTLRRYLIEYGFMDRTTDGREYWRI